MENPVSIIVDDGGILDGGSESEEATSRFDPFGFLGDNGMAKMGEESMEQSIVKRSFVFGMGLFGKDVRVVAIHKNLNSGLTGEARFASFRVFSEAVRRKHGGDANVKYGWYGAPKEEISEILAHGFSGRSRPANNAESYGDGIHLSSAKYPIDGALSSKVDENGLRHVLLCRVLLGKSEIVLPGSKQYNPSSMEFDSAVDSLPAPRRYIVWRASMNSHIYPNYAISFISPNLEGPTIMQTYALRPSSPWMTLQALLHNLSKFLDPAKVAQIVSTHNDFQANKISRANLIRKVRKIAGDKLLIRVIRQCRDEMSR